MVFKSLDFFSTGVFFGYLLVFYDIYNLIWNIVISLFEFDLGRDASSLIGNIVQQRIFKAPDIKGKIVAHRSASKCRYRFNIEMMFTSTGVEFSDGLDNRFDRFQTHY
jgi:hypothetical protein